MDISRNRFNGSIPGLIAVIVAVAVMVVSGIGGWRWWVSGIGGRGDGDGAECIRGCGSNGGAESGGSGGESGGSGG
ncbi:hypothetical protein Tco_1178689 [Tanacetum coccineum]